MNLYQGYCTRRTFDSTNLYNTYYQWVSIFLMIQVSLLSPLFSCWLLKCYSHNIMLQAVIFYIPRCIWLSMEGGLMSFLVKGAQGWSLLDIFLF